MASDNDFEVPVDFEGMEVVLIEDLPVQQPNGQIGYPSIRCKLLKVLHGSLLIETPQGKQVIPKRLLRGINLVSAITVVTSGLVIP